MPLYAYKSLIDGNVYEGLTATEVAELRQKELAQQKADKTTQDEKNAQLKSDAQLGPQIAAGIRAYESQKGQPGQQTPQPQPNPQMLQDKGAMSGMMGQPQAAPRGTVSHFGEEGFMDAVNSAVKQQQAETPSPFSGTPATDSLFSSLSGNNGAMAGMTDAQPAGYPGFTPDQMNKERQASAGYMALIQGIPEETVRALNARFRMGELSPTQFQKELIKANEDMRAFNNKKAEEERQSKLKQDEEKNKAFFTTEDKLLELSSLERRNTEDNKTRLAEAGMRQNTGNKTDVITEAADWKNKLLSDPTSKALVQLYATGNMSEAEAMAKVPGFNKQSGPARLALTQAAIELNPPQWDEQGNLVGGFNPKGFGIGRKAEDQARAGTATVLNKQRMAAQRALSTLDDAYDKSSGSYKNVPDWMYRDLASDYAKILVASGQISEGGVDKIMQKSAKGAVVEIYNRLTGDTKTTAPEKVLTLLHDRIKALNTDLDKQYYNQTSGSNIPINSNENTNPLNNNPNADNGNGNKVTQPIQVGKYTIKKVK